MTSRILLLLASLLISGLSAELISRTWVRSRGDALNRARLILEPDGYLGWRQRPDLKTRFEGKLVVTDRRGFRETVEAREPDVIVMGPSSAFGWGVEGDQTYSARLGRLLGKPLSVLNAGEIGYSVVQGRRLYDELAISRRPVAKVVVLGYGINDLDRFRFYGQNGPTDEEYFGSLKTGDLTWASPKWASLNWVSWMNGWAFPSLIARGWQESAIYRHCGLDRYPEIRVPAGSFEAEFRGFVAQLKADGSRVILVNTPYLPPAGSAGADSEKSDSLYRRSVSASERGECRESERLFLAAKKMETARVAQGVSRVNSMIAEIGNEDKLAVVDAHSELESGKSAENFVDPVHPSPAGHQRIALALSAVIESGGSL